MIFTFSTRITLKRKILYIGLMIVIVSTFASLLLALIVLIVIDNIKTRVAIQKEK